MMKRTVVRLVLFFALVSTSISCAEKASDAEIEKMCTHLLVLRKKPDDEAMKSTCIEEAKTEGTSKRQALCRISAVNAQEYWNRCRTGAARK